MWVVVAGSPAVLALPATKSAPAASSDAGSPKEGSPAEGAAADEHEQAEGARGKRSRASKRAADAAAGAPKPKRAATLAGACVRAGVRARVRAASAARAHSPAQCSSLAHSAPAKHPRAPETCGGQGVRAGATRRPPGQRTAVRWLARALPFTLPSFGAPSSCCPRCRLLRVAAPPPARQSARPRVCSAPLSRGGGAYSPVR